MDLGTFPLVKNTPVFSFYFQSLKNSSFICVPAAPIPAFLIVPRVWLKGFRSLWVCFQSEKLPGEGLRVAWQDQAGPSCDNGHHWRVLLALATAAWGWVSPSVERDSVLPLAYSPMASEWWSFPPSYFPLLGRSGRKGFPCDLFVNKDLQLSYIIKA